MAHFTENHVVFDENDKIEIVFTEMLDNIYIYIYHGMCEATQMRCLAHLYFWEEQEMRIILDTDKKTITVPWNYQRKLDELNDIILAATEDETKRKTFTGYINEIWEYAIKHSDKCVLTGKAPVKKGK